MYIDFQQNRVCRSVKTVHTRLTSTLIKSVKCCKNDYHEKSEKIQHMYHHQQNYYMYTIY